MSCQAKILGDVRIDVPASSQVHHQVVRKDYEAHDIEVDPVVHLYFVEVEQPDMHTPEGDLQRLLRALEVEWGLTGLSWDLAMLAGHAGGLTQRQMAGDGGATLWQPDRVGMARVP